MLVDVVLEKRFFRCEKGNIWTDNAFPLAFWQRYLNVFSHVNIVARVHDIVDPEPDWKQVNGKNVSFTALPGYIGPIGLLKALPETLMVMRKRRAIKKRVIYRIPSVLCWLYAICAGSAAKHYGAEVVGDPADTFTRGASQHPLRPIIRHFFVTLLRRQCKGAHAISYVTQHALQCRYPPNTKALHTHYSSIHLTDADYNEKKPKPWPESPHIVCIGNLSQPYKGCDVMLNALAKMRDQGFVLTMTWVGGGGLLPQMQKLAMNLDVDEQVNFVGNLASRQSIYAQIDKANLFVLPSLQEGLPRVLIECMARSLFCIATRVGGVNELLPNEWVVDPNNSEALAHTIKNSLELNEDKRRQYCHVNYVRAQDFHDDKLQQKREQLYQHLLGAEQ